jgi:UPF0716 protein FxsA
VTAGVLQREYSVGWVLFAVFIVLPLLEIFAFIEVGSSIGVMPTLALILLSAVVGVLLVRWQGLKVFLDARRSLGRNELPVLAVVHGGLLLLAGFLLLTPGFITDTAGFLLLVPPIRSLLAERIWRWLEVRTEIRARYAAASGRVAIIEGEAVEIDGVERLPNPPRQSSPWTEKRNGTTG